jgi:tRNA A-37 threonylcarbamoyl transferase component Bud32
MTPERWQRVNELFQTALELSPQERDQFLERACAEYPGLRAEIESLIAFHEKAENFLESPVSEIGSRILSESESSKESLEPKNLTDLYSGITLNNRYTIEKELGRGGIGVVYLARDKQLLSKPVVIKVLFDESAQNDWVKRKFSQEIEALARIDHPGIVGVLDVGEMPDGKPYFVMQFVEGTTLRSAIPAEGMELDRIAYLMRQMGRALSAAHDKGVYHRDLKPENIMLQSLSEGEQQVKIIDFGIARVENSKLAENTASPIMAGTISYMSPEQLMSNTVSASTDIYAMGIIAYEMVTGRKPFNPSSVFNLMFMQKEGVKVRPSQLRKELGEEAERVILKALSFNPEDRQARARDFGEQLAMALTDGSTSISSALPITGKPEPGGGAVSLDSEFYIVRPTDEEFRYAIARQDSIVLVKGAHQMGKTSLLARGLQHARAAGTKVVLTDFQKLNAAHFVSAETLFMALAEMIADQLELEVMPDQVWNSKRGANVNFERYLRREVLGKIESAVVWGLDEVDRLFSCNFGSEVFGLFRSWHNERSLDPTGPWERFTMAIAYATEAHLFITDMNQSPFTVGTRLALEDFSLGQVSELNLRYGLPLRDSMEIERFYRLVGGHPYLVSHGLHEMAVHGTTLASFEANADRDEGPFGDHLRRILVLLAQDQALCDVVRGVLEGRPCPTAVSFYRLRSAGIMSGESVIDVRPRCNLYKTYLKRYLL